MSVPIRTDSGIEAEIELVQATSKKTGNPYTAVKITIGEWSTMVFPKGTMERNYLIKALS